MWDVNWRRSVRVLNTALAITLLVSLDPTSGALAQSDEIGPHLPATAEVERAVSDVDVDGDGRADVVALYRYRGASRVSTTRPNVLVLAGPAEARRAHHLVDDPANPRFAPVLGAGSTIELNVADRNLDGLAEIALVVRTQDPTAREFLWVWRWDGAEYRTEAMLEGEQVELLRSGAGEEPGLRVRWQQRPWHYENDRPVAFEEVYRWRAGGYRLVERSLAFVGDLPPPLHPAAAVLRFYQLLDRGELEAAYGMLGPRFRAEHPFDGWAAGYAGTRDVIVEEVRPARAHWDLRNDPPLDSPVYVRVTAVDDARPGPRPRSFAGVWRLTRVGKSWQLEEAEIGGAPSLAEIADALPGGRAILQTARGDLRGTGQDDLAVVTRPAGRYTLAEPMVLLHGGGGFMALPLGDLVADQGIGGPGGDVAIEDVTGDGRPELVYGGVVGAHSSVLWVLGWDGGRLAPLFEGFSNSPGLGLVDLDRDGVPEVLMAQSGYCGSYAGSPQLAFALRWQAGAYRPAGADFPDLQGDLEERVGEILAEAEGRTEQPWPAATACIHHLVASGHALAGRAPEARAAYLRYHQARGRVAGDREGFTVLPTYVGAPFFREQVQGVVARAESGRLAGWGPAERAILHDLLGNSFEARWQNARERLRHGASTGPANPEATRREAEEARQQAEQQYRAALALDSGDQEARAGLARLSG